MQKREAPQAFSFDNTCHTKITHDQMHWGEAPHDATNMTLSPPQDPPFHSRSPPTSTHPPVLSL